MSTTKGLFHHVRDFLVDHPCGWNHDDWLHFLHRLQQAGEDTSDPDSIGVVLERQHLRSTLEGLEIRGLGPKRVEALATTYGSMPSLQRTPETQIADEIRIPRSLAALILEKVR